MKSSEAISEWLVQYLAQLVEIEPDAIDPTVSFSEYGMDSTAAAGLSSDLSKWLGVEVKDSVAFDYPTIERLSAHLAVRRAG